MSITEKTVSDKKYLVSEKTGLFYDLKTPLEVIKVIDEAKTNKTRLILDYGDLK